MGHIGQYAEAADAMVAIEQFDQRVGVGDRGRLIADHHKDLLRSTHEADHRIANTGRGVDHQHVKIFADVTERLDQPGVLHRREADHALRTGCCRHDAHAARPLQQDVTQIAFTRDDIGQGALGRQAQQNVDVGQAKVGVHQHDPTAEIGQGHGQIDRHIGLADATLAASHRNHLYGMHTHVLSTPCLTSTWPYRSLESTC